MCCVLCVVCVCLVEHAVLGRSVAAGLEIFKQLSGLCYVLDSHPELNCEIQEVKKKKKNSKRKQTHFLALENHISWFCSEILRKRRREEETKRVYTSSISLLLLLLLLLLCHPVVGVVCVLFIYFFFVPLPTHIRITCCVACELYV